MADADGGDDVAERGGGSSVAAGKDTIHAAGARDGGYSDSSRVTCLSSR